ncbi:hypothetical protein BT96DRAFT_944549 [Gymnopus androsaceus JB14]|uniref:Uncharacterized protein n=1 Tax=Gymnopus androsaceus JB14 TaxID=1447944 RepID=A0A6A4H4B5_9AGAR|nr:hypothetical protein BT96DRAFT_944549 [Gymnopus androsaceus JB14]
MAIVWRAWAVWAENRLIKWSLLIILLVDISIGIADSAVDIKAVININNDVNTNTVTLDWISVIFNLIVNVVGTSLIGYKAWTHHLSVRAIAHNKKTQVETVLLLLVESGAILGVVQCSDNDNLQALNPIAVVILVQTRNTYEHSFHLEDVPSLEINSTPNVS